MNIRPVMPSPGDVPHLSAARQFGEPDLRRDCFSYPSEERALTERLALRYGNEVLNV